MVSRWTDAHEGTDKILALILAIVGRGRTLVHVWNNNNRSWLKIIAEKLCLPNNNSGRREETYAMSRVRGQSVAVGADASEGARGIMASEGALVAQLQTLVHVLADLVHARGESFVARTFEAPFDIGARPVPAYVLLGQALVVVHATSAARVQHVAGGALASEGAIRVYALATCASVRHEEALVQVDPRVVPACSLRAQSFEFLWKEKG